MSWMSRFFQQIAAVVRPKGKGKAATVTGSTSVASGGSPGTVTVPTAPPPVSPPTTGGGSGSTGGGSIPPPPPPPPVVPPAPPPPPPPVLTVPAAVALKGYQTTWGYQNRAAPTPLKVLTVEAAHGNPLPTGWGYDPVNRILYIGDNCDEEGWSFLGASVYNQGAHRVNLRNSLFGSMSRLDYIIRNGDDGNTLASEMNLYGCRVLGRNTLGLESNWSAVNSTTAATFRAYDTDFIDADYRHFSGKGEFYRVYMGKAGVNVRDFVNTHVEQAFFREAHLEDCLLDARGSGVPVSSGNIQTEGGSQVYRRTIMVGAQELGAFVAVQGSGGASFVWDGCIVDPGLSNLNSPTGGYLASNGSTSSSTGSIGYVTAASIDAVLS